MLLRQRVVLAVHRTIARSVKLSALYLALLGWASRRMRGRFYAVAQNVEWPSVDLPARRVAVGGIEFFLHPHVGEADFEAQFNTALSYEPENCEWLAANIGNYDVVVDVGANIGFFTCFLAALNRRRQGSLKIFAFEPAAEAFARLRENLSINGFNEVSAFNAAVAEDSGFREFYEAPGHLSNGSFIRAVADFFKKDTRTSSVLCVAATDIENLIEDNQRVLIKMDVEGYEPEILKALTPFIRNTMADVVVEVLGENAQTIQSLPLIESMDIFHIQPGAALPATKLQYDTTYRDWLLRSKARARAPSVASATSHGEPIAEPQK
jgi:FkbM family methyltransferase